MLFQGAAVAIVTPFHEDGSVNYEEMKKLLEFQMKEGIDAVVVAGTTGEASAMTDEEQTELIDFTVKTVDHRVPVIAGAGSNDTRHGVNLAKMICETGVDGLLQVTPYYNKTSQEGLIAHFDAIAEASDVPIILYDVPGRTGMTILPETVEELSKRENIVGLKDATGDLSYTLEVRRRVPEEFAVYSGNDDLIVPVLSAGGNGVISVLANCAPNDTAKMCREFFDGHTEKALELQLKYKGLIDALFAEVNPIPVRTALEMMGFDIGSPRLPLVKASRITKELLRKEMEAIDLV